MEAKNQKIRKPNFSQPLNLSDIVLTEEEKNMPLFEEDIENENQNRNQKTRIPDFSQPLDLSGIVLTEEEKNM